MYNLLHVYYYVNNFGAKYFLLLHAALLSNSTFSCQ